jgi:hypothetical protein
VVDLGWAGAVGPAQSTAVDNLGAQLTAACHGVVGAAGEEQLVRIGAAAVGPVR